MQLLDMDDFCRSCTRDALQFPEVNTGTDFPVCPIDDVPAGGSPTIMELNRHNGDFASKHVVDENPGLVPFRQAGHRESELPIEWIGVGG